MRAAILTIRERIELIVIYFYIYSLLNSLFIKSKNLLESISEL